VSVALGQEDARRLQECIAGGGVAVFPSDTVYGVCCDPEDAGAVRRLYELKGRPSQRAAAVMLFSLERALASFPELGAAERAALRALLPGPVTLLLPNAARRFELACGPDPFTLGLRVPRLPPALAALGVVSVAVLQSSANISGEADARRLDDVPERLLDGADLVLDGGELPGTPSTVIDLRDYGHTRAWRVLREGALAVAEVESLLAAIG
jgi:L-threonylcarbamoyladenylate synthase